MDAPNKLFLHETKVARPSWHHGRVAESDVEYIRKDLLLEWLEAKVYEYNEDKFDDGFNTAIGQVIDKINSL